MARLVYVIKPPTQFLIHMEIMKTRFTFFVIASSRITNNISQILN